MENNKTLYNLVVECVIFDKDGDLCDDAYVGVSYYANSKEEAIAEAQKVGQAMSRSAQWSGRDLFYRVMDRR